MYFLALRYLLSKKKQTVLTLLGIVLGAAAFICISGMMLGFQYFIIDQLVNNDSHVRITAREKYVEEKVLRTQLFDLGAVISWFVKPSGRREDIFIENPHGWIDRLSNDSRVLAYSPQLVTQVVVSRGKISTAGRLIGSDVEKQVRISNIYQYMTIGKFKDIGASGNRVVIGEGLLSKLGAQIRDNILISSGKGNPVPCKIVGVFKLGVRSLDDSTVFAALSDVQKINETPSRISDIAIRLVNLSDAAMLATHWSALSEDKVQSWDQANEGVMSVFKTQDVVRYSMTVTILIVAGFGIYNILNMTVTQRRKEIAVLRSMGFEPFDILKLFLTQGIILGFFGGIVGVGIGYLLCVGFSHIEISKNRGIGNGLMMISFDLKIYVKAFALSLFASGFSALLPARAAGKLEPIEIIRSEGL